MKTIPAILGLMLISTSVFASQTSLTCPVAANGLEITVSIQATDGKVDFITASDEAKRLISFSGSEIDETGKNELKEGQLVPQSPMYTIRGSKQGDTVSLVIPAQSPLAKDTVTAFAVVYSNQLNARISLLQPAKTICTKQIIEE